MFCNPPGIVYVGHGRESSDQFCPGHQDNSEEYLSENVHTCSTATSMPTQFTRTGTRSFLLLYDGSKLQN
jgi:hypothetical protein